MFDHRTTHRSRTTVVTALVAVFAILAVVPAAAQQAVLVKDIEPSAEGWRLTGDACPFLCPPNPVLHGSSPDQLTGLGDLLLFAAFEFAAGREPWVSDGSTAGTQRLLDLCPGPCSSHPRLVGVVGGELLFWGTESPGGPGDRGSYWMTDGTTAGTRRLETSCGADCRRPAEQRSVLFDGALYFLAGGGVLWRSDGTAGGTAPLRYVVGGLAVAPVRVTSMEHVTVAGERLVVLLSQTSEERSELLRLEPGEERLERLFTLCESPFSHNRELRGSDAGVAFVSHCLSQPAAPASNRKLYVTDGTLGGTRRIFAGQGTPGDVLWPEMVGWSGGDLYFLARRFAPASAQLWVSDGTVAGTRRLLAERMGVVGGLLYRGRVILLRENPLGSNRRELLVYDPAEPDVPTELGAEDVDPASLAEVGGHLLFSAVDGAGREPWVSDGTAAGTRRLADVHAGPGDSNPGSFAASARIHFAADDGHVDRELWAFPRAVVAPESCVTGGDTLCLADGRFRVRVRFRNQHAGGAEGSATAVPGGDRYGFFWFFRQENLELTVKVLDGTSINGHHWLFWGGITDLEYDLEVRDLVSGETRSFHHAPGDLCGGADTRAFPAAGTDGSATLAPVATAAATTPTPLPSPITPIPCGGSDTRLCIGGVWQIFAVTATFRNQYADGAERQAMAMPLSGDSGWFWFFNENNPEVMVKVLDGTAVNGHFWVFIGGLSTVEYEVTVTNNARSDYPTRTYRKPAGSTCGIADVTAFDDF